VADTDFAVLNSHDAADAVPLQYLGAALLFNWASLPDDVRRAIYDQALAGNIVGLPAATDLKEHVDYLIRNNARASDDANRT
jgi:hypothetical protein